MLIEEIDVVVRRLGRPCAGCQGVSHRYVVHDWLVAEATVEYAAKLRAIPPATRRSPTNSDKARRPMGLLKPSANGRVDRALARPAPRVRTYLGILSQVLLSAYEHSKDMPYNPFALCLDCSSASAHYLAALDRVPRWACVLRLSAVGRMPKSYGARARNP